MPKPTLNSKRAQTGAPAPETTWPRLPVWLLAVSLAVATIAVYWPAMRYGFVNYDDPEYVTANPHVQGGLNRESVIWAWRNMDQAAYWAPLMWLSHILACQLFGLQPWGHHFINVLLHSLNAALVFVLFRRLTNATWRSLLVAALFALHPLRVESVAWVTERKDVLSGFFGLLSLIFYVRYAQRRSSTLRSMAATEDGRVEGPRSSTGTAVSALDPRHSTLDYCLALLFFALGLMSKPMLVTWPFVMLLLDYWPLGRLRPVLRSSSATEGGTTDYGLQRGLRTTDCGPQASRSISSLVPRPSSLVLEKLPFFALAAAASCVAFAAANRGGVVVPVENLPFGARVENALVSYCWYLGKFFWPTNLAVFYPHPGHWPLLEVLLAGLLLVVLSGFFFVKRGQYPFLLIGWLWFVGTLVPVIQLVQSGAQAMADRFTYIPSLGMLILTIWGAYELARRRRYRMIALSVAGGTVIFLCSVMTRQQLSYWQDSETLFRHTLAVTENNYLAHNNLGDALDRKGQTDEAIREFQDAIRLGPNFAPAYNNFGAALDRKGQTDEAIEQFQEAIRLKPDYAVAHCNLGSALDRKGQTDEAIRQFQDAIRLKPDYVETHYNLGIAFAKKGQTVEAINQFEDAIRLRPDYAEAHNNLGNALMSMGRSDEAITNYRQALEINPDYFEVLNNLGTALAAKGQLAEAIENYRRAIQLNSTRPDTFVHLGMALEQSGRTREAVTEYREALRLNPNFLGALNNLAWILAASPDDQLRNGVEAVQLAEHACGLTHYGQPFFIGTLAAAYAEAGRFPEAISTAEKAEQLAADAGLRAVAAKNRQLLELYRAGKPYHEPAQTPQK